MTTAMDKSDEVGGYKPAHHEGLRALDYQRAALDALRTRVGLLLSAGAIATSFLGGQALRIEANVWAWLAIGLFVSFGAGALRILWPRAEGSEGFTAVPSILIAELEGGTPPPLALIYRDLALYAEAAHDRNRDWHLMPLTWYFRAAILLLMAEIVAWVVALASQ